jgi:hypothetical protein
MPNRFLYIFLDEAGNFDFSPGGSKYFIMASVTRERTFGDYSEFVNLKYDLVEQGIDIEYFHASEDKQAVRDQVFKIIQRNLTGMRIDAVIVEKKKTKPTLRDPARFYLECWAIFSVTFWRVTRWMSTPKYSFLPTEFRLRVSEVLWRKR